jgi:acyl-CoA synthetase (AMP-forming)/AMP-acid ligase II
VVNDSMPSSIFEAIRDLSTGADRSAAAVIAPGTKTVLTREAFFGQVCGVAAALADAGVEPGGRVALALPNGPGIATCLLGVMSRFQCAPLNPAFTAREFEFYLQDLEPKALILPAGVASPAREIAVSLGLKTLELDTHAATMDIGFGGRPLPANATVPAPPAALSTALLLHTSGTTSRPKLVPLSQVQLWRSATNIRHTLALTASDVSLIVMPLFHIHGLLASFMAPLVTGGAVVCPAGFDPEAFLGWLKDCRPTYYSAVPTIHQRVLAVTQGADVSHAHLRFIRSSSASLAPKLMKDLEARFRCPVIEAYGMTEAAHQMASNPLPPRARKPGTVGIAAGPEISIMSPEGKILPASERGEIVIRGRSVFKGYEANPDANATAFHDGWFRTGDQGFLDADGYLTISGRLKEIINRAGEKISPREIDEAILEHEAIGQAVAFPVEHPTLGEDLAAAVVLRPGKTVSAEELRQFLGSRLSAHKVPQQIVFLPELPKGPSGKVQRIGLANKVKDRLVAGYVAPSTDVEKKLVEIWKKVLDVERPGVRDNFFHLGGDSIQSVMMASLAREAGIAIFPRQIEKHPTIAELAKSAETAASKPGVATAAAHGPVGLLPLQSYLLDGNARVSFAVPLEAQGPIDRDVLRAAARFFVAHHDALRTRLFKANGKLQQAIGPEFEPSIASIDLSGVPKERQHEEFLPAIRALGEEVRLETGRPIGFATLDLGHVSGVVILVHHFVADEYSRAVMAEDFANLYEQLRRGEAPSLGLKSSSVMEWSAYQWARLDAGTLDAELPYWRSIIERFPKNAADKIPAAAGDDRKNLALDPDLSSAILRATKAYGVQLPELVATALARTMIDCTGQPVAPIMWTLSGRSGLPDGFDLARTVGYLPTYAPTLIELPAQGDGRTLTQLVRSQLRGLPDNGANFMWLGRFREPALWDALPAEPFRFNYVGHLGDAPCEQARTLNTNPDGTFATFVGDPLTRISLKRRIKVRVRGNRVLLQIIATKGLYGRTTDAFLGLLEGRLRDLVAGA